MELFGGATYTQTQSEHGKSLVERGGESGSGRSSVQRRKREGKWKWKI